VAAVLDHVPAGVALAEARRDERAADQRHADLAAVEVAGDRERDAVGDMREEVGVVAEQDRRGPVGDPAQRARDARLAMARVVDARDPHVAEAHRLVLEHRDPRRAQGGAHLGPLVRPVMVAHDRGDAERRPQRAEARRDRRRRDARAEAHLGVDVVAEQEDEVGPLRVHGRDEPLDALGADVRRARVQVRHERDPKAVEGRRPAVTEAELALANALATGLLPERAPGDRGRGKAGRGDAGGDGGAGALHARGG